MIRETLFLIGRVLYGGYFVINGWSHFKNKSSLTAYAASKKVPAASLAIIVSGLLIFLGGLGILLGIYVKWSVVLLALFLIPVSFKMHDYWNVADPQMKMAQKVNFTKNLALLGAAFMILMIPGPWYLALF